MLPGRQYTPELIVRLLWYRKWLIIGAILLFTAIAVTISAQLPNTYRSETMILVVPQRVPDSYVRSTVTMRIEDRLRSISEQILSRSRLERVIDDFGLYPEMRQVRPMEDVVAYMRTNIVVDTVRDDAFKVSFIASTPRTAMIVADRLASMFIDENTRDREALAEGTNRFLESQLEEARTRLVEHEKKLEEFRRRYSGQLPSQLESNLQVIRNTQTQIQSLNESIDRDRDRRLILEKAIADAATPGATGAQDASSGDAGGTPSGRTIDQLDRARAELHALELRFKPEHPDIIAKKRTIAQLEQRLQDESASAQENSAPAVPSSAAAVVQLARARQSQNEMNKLDKQIAQKESEIDRLKKVTADYQSRVDSVPGHESEMTALMRDYETLQKSYASLLAKKEDSKISANLERQQVGEQFKVLDAARLPERPYSPNRMRIAMVGAAAGLALALMLAAFLEYRDTSLRTEDEIVKMLVLPVLAAIPIMTAIADRRRRRRNVAVMAAASILLFAAAVTTMWHLGVWKGLF